MAPRPAVSPDWREGRYFDRWMFVHFAAGLAGGFSNRFFDLSAPRALLTAFVVMVAWELGEMACGVAESWTNVVLDVCIGFIGAGVAVGVAPWLHPQGELVAFGLTFVLAVGGSIAGWIAYTRRKRAGLDP